MRKFVLGWGQPMAVAAFSFSIILAFINFYLGHKQRYTENPALWWRYDDAIKIIAAFGIGSALFAATASYAYSCQRRQIKSEFDDQLWEHTPEVNPEKLALFPAHPLDAIVAKFLDTREHEGAWAVQVETEDKKKLWFRVDVKTRCRFIVPGTYVVIPKGTALVPDPTEGA